MTRYYDRNYDMDLTTIYCTKKVEVTTDFKNYMQLFYNGVIYTNCLQRSVSRYDYDEISISVFKTLERLQNENN